MELRQRALDVLCLSDPAAKAAATRALFAQMPLLDAARALQHAGALPGRPPRPLLVPPKQVAQRSPFTTAGRAALLHAVAHIEFNAINLALDAVWRFAGMPGDYYRDWLGVAADEALHFTLLADHLRTLGFAYGDFDAHDGLWAMVERTKGDITARMALVPRTLEARGLDATPPMQARLAKAGDTAAVAILDVILRDEIGHVAVGNRWYRWLCARDGLDPIAHDALLCQRHGAPRLRPPFNVEARRAAGFSDAEIEQLGSRNATQEDDMTFHRCVLTAVLAFWLPASPALAQPDRSLTIVVPSGPGSAPDIIARLVGDALQARLGQPAIVDNRTGAGGIVAVMAARTHASPNTLLLAQAAVATVTPLTYRAAKYDLATDMEPVVVVAETPMMFVANIAKGPKDLAEFISAARAKPNAMPVTSPARGSIPNLAAELLAQAAGISVNLVPMSGSSQALQAVVNGDSLVSVDGIAPLLPLVKAGRLRALAVTSPRKLPGLDAYPLANESVAGLNATGWFMLFARKGTPPARLKQINEAVNDALKSPEVVQRLAMTANYPVGGSIDETRAFLAREKQVWAGAVKKAGLQPE